MAVDPPIAAEIPAAVAALPPEVAPPVAAPVEPSPPSAPAAAAAEPERTPTLLEKFDAEKPKPEVKPLAEAKVPEPAKPDAKAEPAKDAPKADAKDAPKPEAKAEAKPAESEKKIEAEPPKPEPVEYKYELPETIKMDDALKTRTHEAFDELRTTGSAQKLIDLYAEQRTADATQTLKNQFDVFNKTKEGWEKDWLADPEIGGAGHRTALKAIARTRDIGISSAAVGTPQYEADLKAFHDFDRMTGAGSHPAFARMLHNLSRYVSEPQAENIPADIKPTKTNGKAPKGNLYTHPSSANMEAK